MRFTLRPSKTFLFEVLARKLRDCRGGSGLDAAAAGMKNRWMFRTDAYVGLDIDEAALQEGLKKAGGAAGVSALTADLADRIPAETGFFRAVVSTNTLSHLAPAARTTAVRELSRVTAADGTLFCELPIDDGAAGRLLAERFREVRPVYFKNPLSRAYERFFERDGWLGSHPIAGRRPFLLLAWLVSRLEYLTCRWKTGNRHVLYLCRDKKDAPAPK